MKGARTLVTGGAGFIGSHLVEALVDRGASVVVVDDLYLGRRENLAEAMARGRVELVEADAGDLALMSSLLRDRPADLVFNLAVIPLPVSLTDPHFCVVQNVRATAATMEAARLARTPRVVHFSSSEVYGTALSVPMTEDHPQIPLTPYGAAKVAQDQIALSYARTFGMDVRVLRPFNNFGPRQNDRSYAGLIPVVMNRILAGEPVEIHGDGLQTRDFIYASDTARAAVLAAEAEGIAGTVVNVAGGRETTVLDVVAALKRAMGRPDHPVVHVAARAGDVRRHAGGSARAAELLGFRPEVSLDEGLARTVAWRLAR